MEEAAPPDAGSGGTPTAMVAVPMLSTALGQRLSMLGGTGVSTKMDPMSHFAPGKAFSRARDARGVGATVDDVYKTVRNKLRAPTPLYVTPHAHDTPERGERPSLAL